MILILVLMSSIHMFSQKYYPKRKILTIEDISISYVKPRLFINVKTTKLHFQLWNNENMVLNATNGMGEESFPVMSGRYKLILFCRNGDIKTQYFRI